jgi:hypothetical protein
MDGLAQATIVATSFPVSSQSNELTKIGLYLVIGAYSCLGHAWNSFTHIMKEVTGVC